MFYMLISTASTALSTRNPIIAATQRKIL